MSAFYILSESAKKPKWSFFAGKRWKKYGKKERCSSNDNYDRSNFFSRTMVSNDNNCRNGHIILCSLAFRKFSL